MTTAAETSGYHGKKWSNDEIEFLRANYPQRGKTWCATQLGTGEGPIRYMASKLGLKQDRNSEFFKNWQERAATSKIGKKRPDQALVMKKLQADGKLIKSDAQKRPLGLG